jgi:hypothetical protein
MPTGCLNKILLISVQGTVLSGYFSSSSAWNIKHDPSINMALKELRRSKGTACSNGCLLCSKGLASSSSSTILAKLKYCNGQTALPEATLQPPPRGPGKHQVVAAG